MDEQYLDQFSQSYEWTNEEFYNPFGPNILQLKIPESVRLKLLNLVKDHLSQDWKEPNIIGENTRKTQGDKDLLNIQNDTLVDGKMGIIDEQWQKKRHDNIVKNTIQSLLSRYGELIHDRTSHDSTITEAWYAIMREGDFHVLHSHRLSELSGAIYLDVPDNLPYPQGDITWIHGGAQQPLYNNACTHSPKNGDVFLWPGWLMHMVYPFRSKQDRIMISFNGETGHWIPGSGHWYRGAE